MSEPSHPQPESPGGAEGLKGWRRWVTSSLLIVFTIITALGCIIVLAATLTQTRVSSTAMQGTVAGITTVNYIGRKWATLQVRVEDASRRRSDSADRTDTLAATATTTSAARKTDRDMIEGLLVDFNFRIQQIDPEIYGRIHEKGYDVQVNVLNEARERLAAKNADLSSSIDAINRAYRSFLISDQAATTAQAALKANQDAIAALDAVIKRAQEDTDQQLELVKPGLAQDKDGRARLENAFYELNINNFDCGLDNTRCKPFEGMLNRGLYQLLTLRPDLLTLLLVILMGVLGSALQISHAYFMKNETQTIGSHFQRITVGAMTALVIFIVAKAGVPVLADPTRLGGDAPINPYFVSFLAIISGLLSENAIANIQTRGANLFGSGSDGPPRWARMNLTTDLEAQKLSTATLAGYLSVSEPVAAGMIKGSEKMTGPQQSIVSLYLRREPRDIFTDIPPSSKAEA